MKRTVSVTGVMTSAGLSPPTLCHRRGSPACVLALTATATPAVRREIALQLALVDPFLLVNSFDRLNLFFGVLPCTVKAKLSLCRLGPGNQRSCIVYVARSVTPTS